MKNRLRLPLGAQFWANDGSVIPEWLCPHMIDRPSHNGAFMIQTPLGRARVHKGYVVVEHLGNAWCRPPGELSELLLGIEAEIAPGSAPIGPGKAAAFGHRSKAKKAKPRGGERKKSFRRPIGSMPSIEWVHVADLSVDQSYQRSIDNEASRRLIAGIAANFDWRLCAPLVVSRRPDGSKVIIDGQHRWAAAVRRGDLPQLPCCLFTYDSPEDEARMFIVANRARKPMNRLDDFHAALAAADEDAHDVRRLVEEAGLKVARSTAASQWKPGEIAFTSSIVAATRRHGDSVVSAALTCLAEAYAGQPMTHGGSIFGALVRIFAKPPAGFDPDHLLPVLQDIDMQSVGEIIRNQRGTDARAEALAREVLIKLALLDQQ